MMIGVTPVGAQQLKHVGDLFVSCSCRNIQCSLGKVKTKTMQWFCLDGIFGGTPRRFAGANAMC